MITQSGSIFEAPLDQTLPPALSYDPRMTALAAALAKQFQKQAILIRDTVGIYYRVDELNSTVLDMLAADLHVDWYDYDASLQVKRNLIKNSVAIHRMSGTLAGLRLLVESIHGDSSIEEWFGYGGEPYCFRIGINITDANEVISQKSILDAVSTYKPVRAHLEDDAIAYRSENNLKLTMKTGYVAYYVPVCGTVPGIVSVGVSSENNMILTDILTASAYSTPKTGDVAAGTEPVITTAGAGSEDSMVLTDVLTASAYSTPKTGDVAAGTEPASATAGAGSTDAISVETNAMGITYETRICGGSDFC